MKPIIQFLLFSLLIRLTFSLAQAQSTVYGTGAGMGGIYSTHIGTYAGRVSTGHENTFVGNSNGYSNNTFVGISCGSSNTTGSNNTFLGYSSGNNNTAGVGNVFIGHYAGFYETGSNKFYVANSTSNNPLLYGEFDNNSLAIGQKYSGTAYKLVMNGKAYIQDGVFTASDKRLKKDIATVESALEKVKQVRGVTYLMKEVTYDSLAIVRMRKSGKPQPKQYDFIAQELQEVFPELVLEEDETLAVNYQGMIPVLVEAIKELTLRKDSVIQTLLTENLQMKQELSDMKQALQQNGIFTGGEASSTIGSLLEQNHPNPFSQSTTIRYQVPSEAHQVGLLITNLQGVEVQRFDQLPAGAGEVQVTAGGLTPGTYVYTLIVDGLPIASQKMILTR